jgi:putative sigma-54 modulation protein
MNLQIIGRHFDVSDRLRKRVEKEAAKLARFCDRIVDCQVFVASEKRERLVEVVLSAQGHTLKAERKANSVYQALDESMARVKTQLKKLNDKRRERRREGLKAAPAGRGRES